MSALTLADRYPLVAQLEAARPHRFVVADPYAAPRGWCDICHAEVVGALNGFCRRHLALQARSRLHIRKQRRSPRRNLAAWGHELRAFRGFALATIGGGVIWTLLLYPFAEFILPAVVRWLGEAGR